MSERWTAKDLSLDAAVGQLVCPTLFGAQLGDRPYHAEAVALELERYGWGGYILFHAGQAQTRERLAALRAASRLPLLVAADMEHGAGQQIEGLSAFAPAMAFGAAGAPELAYRLGAWTAREALSVGVNWVLAPVADVTVDPLNPIIGIRSFGGDPARVAEMVAAFVRGCQDQGALACAKHFPGHGDTGTDSHTRLAAVMAPRARLEAVEWPPFRAAIASGVASIMSAHLALPGLGIDGPATLSRAAMTGLLREELGFTGLIVSDALLMGGITTLATPAEAAVQAVLAGCDVLLMPPDPCAAHAALVSAVEDGTLGEARVYEAAERVLSAKRRLAVPGAPAPRGAARDLSLRVAREALTLAKGEQGAPLAKGTLCVGVDDGADPSRLSAWRRALDAHGLARHTIVSRDTTPSQWEALIQEAESAPGVLVGVFSPIRVSKDRSLLTEDLVSPLRAIAGRASTTVVSFSSPFLVAQLPEAQRWVLAYGAEPEQIEAAIDALGRGLPLPGTLPVTLPLEVPTPAARAFDERPPSGPAFA
ncbi:MAG TPA: glycoside hydrolase family 3 protein [Pantanalinema sp.]